MEFDEQDDEESENITYSDVDSGTSQHEDTAALVQHDSIQYQLTMIHKHPDNDFIIVKALKNLGVYANDSAHVSWLLQHHLLQLVETVMTRHHDVHAVCEAALFVIYCLAQSNDSHDYIARSGILHLVMTSMDSFCLYPLLAQFACGTLHNLATNYIDVLHDIGAYRRILNAMLSHVSNATVQASAFGIMKQLTMQHHGHKALLGHGMLTILLGAMDKHCGDEYLSVLFLQIIYNLANNNENHEVLTSAGVYQRLMMNMEQHADPSPLHNALCKCICMAALHNNYKPLPSMLLVMSEYKTDADVQEWACDMLSRLTPDDDEAILATQVLRTAADLHSESAHIQASVLATYGRLARTSKYRAVLYKDGVLSCIYKAMDMHVDDAAVQQQGCFALFQMSQRPEICVALEQSGCSSTVLRAMTRHMSSSSVQKQALMILCMLSAHRGAPDVARDIVTTVISMHADDADVLEYGRMLLETAVNEPDCDV